MRHFAISHAANHRIDPAEQIAVGKELPASSIRLAQQREDGRNVFLGLALAAFGTGEGATEMERERVNTDALIAGHDAEQHTTPAAQFCQIVGGFDDFRIPSAINRDIRQSTENFLNPISSIFSRSIDLIRQAVLRRFGQFVIMKVNPDDGTCSGQFGAKHNSEPDAPHPKNYDRFARLDLRVVVDDTEPGGERVRQQATKFEIRVGRNFGQTVFGNDRIPLESCDWTGVHIAPVPFVNRAARIDPRPRTPVANHTVTGRDMRHVCTNLEHDGPSFMPEQMRKELIRTLDPIDLADLGSADTRGMDLDQHLPALKRRNLDFVDDERLALLDQNGGGCFQRILTTDNMDFTNRCGPD